jgi:hypothetical protein
LENTELVNTLKCLDEVNNAVFFKHGKKRCEPLFSKTEKGEQLKQALEYFGFVIFEF